MCRAVWSTSLSDPAGRRALLRRFGVLALGGGAALALPGCGFRPLYAPADGNGDGDGPAVAAELATVRVSRIPERFGQLLRRGLEHRLARGASASGPASPARYELRVSPALAVEGVGFTRDGTATRSRYVASGNWVLLRLGPPQQQIAAGVERTTDAFNVPTSQFFASDASRDAAERRLTEALADQIVSRLAVEFRRRLDAAAAAPAGTAAG